MKNRLIPCVLACLMIFLVGCKSKKFHSVRVGGQYRISKKSFENWLNGEKGGSEDGIC